jgi:hypothetical protein
MAMVVPNKPLVLTRKSEALLLAAQRQRWAAMNAFPKPALVCALLVTACANNLAPLAHPIDDVGYTSSSQSVAPGVYKLRLTPQSPVVLGRKFDASLDSAWRERALFACGGEFVEDYPPIVEFVPGSGIVVEISGVVRCDGVAAEAGGGDWLLGEWICTYDAPLNQRAGQKLTFSADGHVAATGVVSDRNLTGLYSLEEDVVRISLTDRAAVLKMDLSFDKRGDRLYSGTAYYAKIQ